MFWKNFYKYLPLPLLVAAYPVLFLYGQNASALTLSSLAFPLGASLLVAAGAYCGFCLLLRRPPAASLAAAAGMVLFNLYGSLYHLVDQWKIFPARNAYLLPLALALMGLVGLLAGLIKPRAAKVIHKILLVAAAGLVAYNLFGVTLVAEVQKAAAHAKTAQAQARAQVSLPKTGPSQKKPDIYYIILDEYSGFESMHDYFQDSSMDQFRGFLEQQGFFIADHSRSKSSNTAAEIASRLNMQPYGLTLPNQLKMDGLSHNKVMDVLRSKGYTTVAIDMAFQNLNADITVRFNSQEVGGMAADEFQQNFFNTTVFRAFSRYFISGSQAARKQRDMIFYSLEKTRDPDSLSPNGEISTPKFVFTHILLPHEPFIFDENGRLLPADAATDWKYYLGQHRYATKLVEQLVSDLMAQADPANPPVIILQSDHGARNIVSPQDDPKHSLKNYPSRDMYDILNALYLPGVDSRTLSGFMDPNETFVIVLNHYLGTGLQVNHTPVQPVQ